MSDPIVQFSVPRVSPGAMLVFENGRPTHYLLMHLHAPDIPVALHRAFFHVCQMMTRRLQDRASVMRDDGNGLFPESRTWEDWRGFYTWEFWWQEEEWDIPRLWSAINGVGDDAGWFEATFAKIMSEW